MKLTPLYFGWLQKGNPTGVPERLPELHDRFATSMAGVYCIGDLTGVPLIKLAAESGVDIVDQLHADQAFRRECEQGGGGHDLVIVGAGPAGMSAAMRARQLGYRAVVIEAARPFATIAGFPAGKPILVTPAQPPARSGLVFTDGTKETLLSQLTQSAATTPVDVRDGERAERVTRQGGGLVVHTDKGMWRGRRVIIATGKTGNPRRLGVPGEDLPTVFHRLIDPGVHHDHDILVVGGGDSAVEAAIGLAGAGNRVTLSYRGGTLARSKEANREALESLVRDGRARVLYGTTVTSIRGREAVLATRDGEQIIPCDAVYVLIGGEASAGLFRRSGIRLQGERSAIDYVKIAVLLFFSCVLYFGKKAPVVPVGDLAGFFALPARFLAMDWAAALKGIVAWSAFLGMTAGGAVLLAHAIARPRMYVGDGWSAAKHAFLAATYLLFGWLYVVWNLAGSHDALADPSYWYTAVYSLAILLFGVRRMAVRPTGYIVRQTSVLMAVQLIPLFILPVFVLPWMGNHGLLSDWVMVNVFPGHSYWRAFGLVLAWPLFLYNLATGQPTLFWLTLGLIQTFVIIPYVVHRWGKGAYCGWVCSCGALAETLGDEYRGRAPHGPRAKGAENAGQVVLWLAAVVTVLMLARGVPWVGTRIPAVMLDVYGIVVDIVLAGVMGLGLYFSMSGRVWCRFFCPLAALMHIYARFSRYRILADKKRCISCGICTRVCHMGIDVMGFANKGMPMDDVQCVRCSACVVNCPMQVLTFGQVNRTGFGSPASADRRPPVQGDWTSGLGERELRILQEAHRERGDGEGRRR